MAIFRNLHKILFVILLTSCGGTSQFKNYSISSETRMSESIFLDPITQSEGKNVLVEVRNTSGKTIDLENQLKQIIISKGYNIVHDASLAQLIIQVNILQAGQIDDKISSNALNVGFGRNLGGAALGASIGLMAGQDFQGGIIGSAVGVGVSEVINIITTANQYSAIVDLQISQKNKHTGEEIVSLKYGAKQSSESKWTNATEWKKYQTRIVSTAKKMRLKSEQAFPVLATELAKSIGGIL